MVRLLHLTDPHLSALDDVSLWRLRGKRRLGYLSWTRRRQFLHRTDILARLLVAARAEQADVIAVTGDLVQLALPSEVLEARDWLAQLGAPAGVVLVPGNHDLYQHDAYAHLAQQWAPWMHVSDATADSFPSVQRYGELTVIGLCSARPEPFWSAGGELGEAQLERFETALEAARDSLRCVLIHHPPLAGLCAPRKALRDTAALEALLARHGVEMVLYGHVHHNQERLFAERTRVLASASASNIARSARASYRVFDVAVDARGWEVEATLKTLSADGQDTELVSRERWAFPRRSAGAQGNFE